MDPEKPFKTIEVVDARTNQLCKVACMSCIRGHRTTSCGIPVCRPKIFWTVKRPGRPSNSCTCRFGATGGCKCVVARTACPHKSKKGEKRSGECRCDEQGRYCCLLEPEHWTALVALQKPTVTFFPSREALETSLAIATAPRTPSFPAPSPHAHHSVSHALSSGMTSPQIPPNHVASLQIGPNSYDAFHSTKTTLTPRFGMMGVGAPQGLPTSSTPDVLIWQGEAPQAPREYPPPPALHFAASEPSSCCQNSVPSTPSIPSHLLHLSNPFEQPVTTTAQETANEPYSDSISLAPVDTLPAAPVFDFNRLQMDYFHYQFPSAICQNCGLSGCSCKNCPPVFQNFGTTSWAQCCGRKHARDSPSRHRTPDPHVANKVARLRAEQTVATGPPPPSRVFPRSPAASAVDHRNGDGGRHHNDTEANPDRNSAYADLDPDLASFDLDGPLNLPDGPDALDITEFLISDFVRAEPPGDDGESGSSETGGGGCCCGGR